jgi:hypothetical protein
VGHGIPDRISKAALGQGRAVEFGEHKNRQDAGQQHHHDQFDQSKALSLVLNASHVQ